MLLRAEVNRLKLLLTSTSGGCAAQQQTYKVAQVSSLHFAIGIYIRLISNSVIITFRRLLNKIS